MGLVATDVNGRPYPQYKNAINSSIEEVLGRSGAPYALLVDVNGSPLFVAGNAGQVDMTDRAARLLGKVTADDSAIVQLGALAATAVTDPAQSASVVALLKGILKQLQGTGTGKQPVVNQNTAGSEIFTSANPAKVSADDSALAQIGALASAAVTDPTLSASVIALLKGLIKQTQGNGTGRMPVADQSETLTTAPITRIVTLTETPIALNSKANLKQITVRSMEPVLCARIGETGMTPANGKGIVLEPFAIYQETFESAVAVTIYGRSEGASMQVQVYEV